MEEQTSEAVEVSKEKRQDKNLFQVIFEEHWEEFKQTHPAYDCAPEVVLFFSQVLHSISLT